MMGCSAIQKFGREFKGFIPFNIRFLEGFIQRGKTGFNLYLAIFRTYRFNFAKWIIFILCRECPNVIRTDYGEKC